MKEGKLYELKIPVPDQTTEEVEIIGWKKNEGDQVKRGDIVFEIETDKATLEVESFGSGVLLKRFYEQGTKLPVGCVVALLGPAGTKIDDSVIKRIKEAASQTCKTGDTAEPTLVTASEEKAEVTPERREAGAIKASPNARRLANDLGVNLSKVTGTGRGGRIEGDDVKEYAESSGPV